MQPPRISTESSGLPGRRRVLLGLLAACGFARAAPPPQIIDLGTHLSINGWVVSKRTLAA